MELTLHLLCMCNKKEHYIGHIAELFLANKTLPESYIYDFGPRAMHKSMSTSGDKCADDLAKTFISVSAMFGKENKAGESTYICVFKHYRVLNTNSGPDWD